MIFASQLHSHRNTNNNKNNEKRDYMDSCWVFHNAFLDLKIT